MARLKRAIFVLGMIEQRRFQKFGAAVDGSIPWGVLCL